MAEYMDFFSKYIIGSIQMLTGAYFFTAFLQKKIKSYLYIYGIMYYCNKSHS